MKMWSFMIVLILLQEIYDTSKLFIDINTCTSLVNISHLRERSFNKLIIRKRTFF